MDASKFSGLIADYQLSVIRLGYRERRVGEEKVGKEVGRLAKVAMTVFAARRLAPGSMVGAGCKVHGFGGAWLVVVKCTRLMLRCRSPLREIVLLAMLHGQTHPFLVVVVRHKSEH